jgi:hypothetical protein
MEYSNTDVTFGYNLDVNRSSINDAVSIMCLYLKEHPSMAGSQKPVRVRDDPEEMKRLLSKALRVIHALMRRSSYWVRSYASSISRAKSTHEANPAFWDTVDAYEADMSRFQRCRRESRTKYRLLSRLSKDLSTAVNDYLNGTGPYAKYRV